MRTPETRDLTKRAEESTGAVHPTAVEHEMVEPTPTYPLSSSSFLSVPGHINTPDDDAVQASSPTSTDREEEVLPLPPPLPCVREYMSPSRSGSPASDDNLPSSLYSPISDAPLPASLRSPTIATNKSALPLKPMSPQLPPQRCPSGGKDKGKKVGERKKKLKDLNSKYNCTRLNSPHYWRKMR